MDVVSSYHDLVRTNVLPLVPEQAGRVLDLGGGIGATSLALKDQGRATSIMLIDQVADQALPGIDVAEAVDLFDLDKLDAVLTRNGPFDTILCLDVLEHLVEPWATVDLLEKHLTDGGALVVSLPNVSHWSVIVPLILGGRFRYADKGIMDRTHLRWFSKEGATDLVSRQGMTVETVKANIWTRAEKLLDIITLKLLSRFFAAQYFLRAQKSATR